MNEHRNYFHVTIFSYISLVYLSNDKSFWWQSHAMKNKNNFEKIKFEWLSRIRADKMLFSNLQRKSWHKIKGPISFYNNFTTSFQDVKYYVCVYRLHRCFIYDVQVKQIFTIDKRNKNDVLCTKEMHIVTRNSRI